MYDAWGYYSSELSSAKFRMNADYLADHEEANHSFLSVYRVYFVNIQIFDVGM
jgi:hypothetical protein